MQFPLLSATLHYQLLHSWHHDSCFISYFNVAIRLPFSFVTERHIYSASISVSHDYGPVNHALHHGSSSQRVIRGGVPECSEKLEPFLCDQYTATFSHMDASQRKEDLGKLRLFLLFCLPMLSIISVLVEVQLPIYPLEKYVGIINVQLCTRTQCTVFLYFGLHEYDSSHYLLWLPL